MGIDELREEIKEKDLEIIRLISERIDCAERIALLKSEQGLPIKNHDVEKKVIDRYVSEGRKYGIDEDTMRVIAQSLIDECVNAEEKVIEKI